MSGEEAAIRALLAQREPESRRLGAQRLGQVHEGGAAELLLRALADEDWRVRKEAAAVAPALERRGETIRALVGALDEKVNIGLRNAAVEALIAIGRDAVPATVDALGVLDADGRKLAVEILGGVPDAPAVRALAGALRDPDVNVLTSAAEALGNASAAGEAARAHAIEALIALLASKEVLVKLAALESLARLDAKVEWSVCEPLTTDPVLRRHAISAAARSRQREAVAALASAIGDRSFAVSSDALVALVECILLEADSPELADVARERVRSSPAAGNRIRALVRSEDTRVRGAALVAIGLLQETVDVQLLAEGLGDEEVSSRAELGLRLFGKDAVGPLIEAGRKSEPPLRATAISLVPLLAQASDRTTLEALYEALGDPSPDVVAATLGVIAATGGAADLERVVPYLMHADPRVAATASASLHSLASRHVVPARALLTGLDARGPRAVVGCIVLGSIVQAVTVPPNPAAEIGEDDLRFLRAAVAHEDARVRRAAVAALSVIGGETAGDAVALALGDEVHDVRLAAIRALGRMGRAEPLVTLLDSSRDPEMVAAALRALAEASPERAFEVARPLVRAPVPAVACAAVEAIGSLRGSRRDDGLFEALEHADAEVVKAALSELGRQLDARALARLGLCLDHESWEVRRLAAELLGQEGSAPAHALLRARMDREKDVAVREALTMALAARSFEVD
jgi:HEAT repeat protein